MKQLKFLDRKVWDVVYDNLSSVLIPVVLGGDLVAFDLYNTRVVRGPEFAFGVLELRFLKDELTVDELAEPDVLGKGQIAMQAAAELRQEKGDAPFQYGERRRVVGYNLYQATNCQPLRACDLPKPTTTPEPKPEQIVGAGNRAHVRKRKKTVKKAGAKRRR
jgi:hypothetical protein